MADRGADPVDLERGPRTMIANSNHESSIEKPEEEGESEKSNRESLESPSTGNPAVGTGNDLGLSRTASLQRVKSKASNTLVKIRLGVPIPPFTHPHGSERSSPECLVDFEGPDDPYRPLNWPFRKKALTTVLYGLTAMCGTFASSVFSSANDQLAQEYNVSGEVVLLGTSLFVAGLGLGPLIFGPLSELYGRKYVVLFPVVLEAIFAFAGGACSNVQSIIICRFFQFFY